VGRTIARGADHPLTLSSKNNLSATLLSLSQYDAAADGARDALEGHQRLYEFEHPSTLSSISFLATILLYQERYDEGAKMHRQALQGRIKALGYDHIDTLASLRKLLEVLIFLDRSDEVQDIFSLFPDDDVGAVTEGMSVRQRQLD
jgi:tetratricopeptide (TPR) repeat protein